MDDAQPPLPSPDALTAPFWDACRNGRLEVSACEDCGHCFLPPGPCCPRCWSTQLAPQPVSGRGRVESFAVYRRTYHPGMPAPYVVALIELEEGPRLVSNVVGCAPEEVAIEMPVVVRFERVGEFVLPRFAPLARGGRNP
ncbi:MAG: Zn-ribbon domain-containing OB-fold protein [Myxococcota bacterium]